LSVRAANWCVRCEVHVSQGCSTCQKSVHRDCTTYTTSRGGVGGVMKMAAPCSGFTFLQCYQSSRSPPCSRSSRMFVNFNPRIFADSKRNKSIIKETMTKLPSILMNVIVYMVKISQFRFLEELAVRLFLACLSSLICTFTQI
jgi:hypothetical protein